MPDATRRCSPVGRAWRLGVGVLLLVLLVCGSAWGTERDFPFGPMVQYAFRTDPNGRITSAFIMADTAAGRRVRVPFAASGTGLKRAEVEGQMTYLRAHPAVLQRFADARARDHPDRPRFTRVYLMLQVIRLRDGVAAQRFDRTAASWNVR